MRGHKDAWDLAGAVLDGEDVDWVRAAAVRDREVLGLVKPLRAVAAIAERCESQGQPTGRRELEPRTRTWSVAVVLAAAAQSTLGIVGYVAGYSAGMPGMSAYAASKAGLIGMTKSIAKELASRNILANVVAPGFIETDMTAAMTPEARAAMSAGIPLERLGTPDDVAGMVAVLASDLSRYVTGQVFVVDGGLVM